METDIHEAKDFKWLKADKFLILKGQKDKLSMEYVRADLISL